MMAKGPWPPFSIPAERIQRCTFGANLVILAQINCKLSRGKTKFPRILNQNGQHDHDFKVNDLHYKIPAESIPCCMFGANLVILDELCDELSHRQPECPRILSQSDLNDIEGQGQWPPIWIPAEYHSMHVWCKFGDFSWNRADTVKFADGGTDTHRHTDEMTQAKTILLRPERPRSENMFLRKCTYHTDYIPLQITV